MPRGTEFTGVHPGRSFNPTRLLPVLPLAKTRPPCLVVPARDTHARETYSFAGQPMDPPQLLLAQLYRKHHIIRLNK